MTEMKGRVIKKGAARGEALVTGQAISFFGGVNPDTGVIMEKGHELEGKSIKGKILVFAGGKGSTVGSVLLYRLRRNGVAPLGMVLREAEPIVAVGAIVSEIPTVDRIDISKIKTGDSVSINGDTVTVNA